jgi:hypothetical protein
MTDIQAFISGRKPSLLHALPPDTPGFYDDWVLLQGYPWVHEVVINTLPGVTIYFQDEEKKQNYLDRVGRVIVDSAEYHRLLGVTLGYPPKAAECYALLIDDLHTPSVGMGWDGIGCTGGVHDIEVNVSWLWDHYPSASFVDDVRISYYPTYYDPFDEVQTVERGIKYRDYVTLKCVADELGSIDIGDPLF